MSERRDALSEDGVLCRRVLDALEDHAIVTLDSHGTVTGWSRGAERLFGHAPGDVLGQSFEVAFTPEDRANGVLERMLWAAGANGRVEAERWHLRADGGRFWGRVTTHALRDDGGPPRAFACVACDATEARQNRERLRQESERRAEIRALQEELAREALDPGSVMVRIVERTRALTGAGGAVLALLEDDALVYRAASGPAAGHIGMRLALDRSVSGWSVRTGQVGVSEDAWDDPRADAEAAREVGIRSLVVVPLLHGGRAVGVLKIHSTERGAFGPTEVETLELMAGFFAATLARAAERSRLQATLDALPVGVFIADATGRLVEVNAAGRALWGEETPFVEGERERAWWPETERPVAASEWGLARALEAGETCGPETIVIEAADGERRTVLHYARPIRNGGSLTIGAVAVSVDVTDLERARARLSLLESVVEAADDAVTVTEPAPLDAPGPRILYVSPAFTTMTGYAAAEAIGRDPRFLQGPETDRGTTGRIRAALEAGAPVRAELVNYRKDGTTFWVELSIAPVRDARGRLVHWASVHRDTTARRGEAEAALRFEREHAAHVEAAEGRRRVEMVLESITDAFVAFDRHWRFNYVNRRAAEHLGRERESLIGRVLWDEFPELRGAAGEAEVRRSMDERTPVRFEARAPTLDAWFEVRAYPTDEGLSLYLHDVTERRRFQEALRHAKEDLEALIQAAPLAIVAFDLEGRVELWNPAAERIFGWKEAEVLGQPSRTVPEDRRGEVEHQIELARRGEVLAGFESERLRRDGSPVTVSVSTAPLRSADGGLRGVLALFEDATERREAADAQRRLTAILEGTTDLVATTDLDGNILYLNRAGREMLGLGPDEVIGRSLVDFLPDWSATRVLTAAVPAAMRLGSWRGESAVTGAEGREIPVSQVVIAHRGEDGEVPYVSTVIRDMTERQRSEEAQRFLSEAGRTLAGSLEYEEALGNVLALAVPRLADYVLVDRVEDDGVVRRVGALHREPSRQPLLDALRRFPPGGRRAIGPRVALSEGRSERVPEVTPMWLRALAVDDEHLRVLQALGPRSELAVPLWVRGRVIGALTFVFAESGRRYGREEQAVAEDLASRAAIALDNAQLHRAARDAVRTRDEVLRVVAHDLRSPITTISLTAGALLEEGLPADVGADLDRIVRSADRAQRLIADLLDLARLQSGKLAVVLAPIAPAAVVDEVVDQHRPQAAEKGVALEADAPADLPPIAADRDRLIQILANLIENAVKFTPDGGRLGVRAERVEGAVSFSVSDTGPGLAPDELPYLFDPFWQAQAGAHGGAGLGLPICKGLVEAHGGQIEVESAVGRGTTFRFTVPLADDGAP